MLGQKAGQGRTGREEIECCPFIGEIQGPKARGTEIEGWMAGWEWNRT